eukprot:TRINITY_DN5575_c0_g1_i1.p1 TRINITY_DN5575_c0_g1~~TRINITY_DN5575_c0_g1_i1.p1  ORF type:complete len:390 (+),score=102.35 TRINITY_DN5575_c0_g1_i1:79-1248(+)
MPRHADPRRRRRSRDRRRVGRAALPLEQLSSSGCSDGGESDGLPHREGVSALGADVWEVILSFGSEPSDVLAWSVMCRRLYEVCMRNSVWRQQWANFYPGEVPKALPDDCGDPDQIDWRLHYVVRATRLGHGPQPYVLYCVCHVDLTTDKDIVRFSCEVVDARTWESLAWESSLVRPDWVSRKRPLDEKRLPVHLTKRDVERAPCLCAVLDKCHESFRSAQPETLLTPQLRAERIDLQEIDAWDDGDGSDASSSCLSAAPSRYRRRQTLQQQMSRPSGRRFFGDADVPFRKFCCVFENDAQPLALAKHCRRAGVVFRYFDHWCNLSEVHARARGCAMEVSSGGRSRRDRVRDLIGEMRSLAVDGHLLDVNRQLQEGPLEELIGRSSVAA